MEDLKQIGLRLKEYIQSVLGMSIARYSRRVTGVPDGEKASNMIALYTRGEQKISPDYLTLMRNFCSDEGIDPFPEEWIFTGKGEKPKPVKWINKKSLLIEKENEVKNLQYQNSLLVERNDQLVIKNAKLEEELYKLRKEHPEIFDSK